MIQGAAGISMRADYGSDNLARSGVQRAKREDESRTKKAGDSSSGQPVQTRELTQEEQRLVQALKQIDRQVRTHEQAHVSAGGDLVRGGASFTYQTGPDNKRYAVAGEVSIDISPAQTPEDTIPKARHIRETALAPADPSPQDRNVAGQATRMENEARRALSARQGEETVADATGRSRVGLYLGVGRGSLHAEVGTNLNIFA